MKLVKSILLGATLGAATLLAAQSDPVAAPTGGQPAASDPPNTVTLMCDVTVQGTQEYLACVNAAAAAAQNSSPAASGFVQPPGTLPQPQQQSNFPNGVQYSNGDPNAIQNHPELRGP